MNIHPVKGGKLLANGRGESIPSGGGESIPIGGGVFSLWWGCCNYAPFGQVKSQLLLITLLVNKKISSKQKRHKVCLKFTHLITKKVIGGYG